MDVISEIIAYEKHAEEIVAQANKKAEAILSDAAALREKERIVLSLIHISEPTRH